MSTATAERRITLRDGIATVEDVTLVAVAPATGILPSFASRLPTTMPVLPDGTSAYTYDPNTKQGVIIVSRKPQTVDLLVTINNDDEESWAPDDEDWNIYQGGYKKFRVSLPYLHWVWHFASSTEDPNDPRAQLTYNITYLYWSPERLMYPDSALDRMELPNIYNGTGHICWGDVASDLGSFASRIDSRITAYFQTEFNEDLGLNMPEQYSSYAQWSEASANDAYCWTSWPFHRDTRVQDLLAAAGTPASQVPQAREGWTPPPERFTVARARDYALTLPPDARRRLERGIALANAAPPPDPSARFVIREIDGVLRIVDTQTDRFMATNIRDRDLLEGRRTVLETRAASGMTIATNSANQICACSAGVRNHNIEPQNYEPDFFTTQGHVHESDQA